MISCLFCPLLGPLRLLSPSAGAAAVQASGEQPESIIIDNLLSDARRPAAEAKE